VTACILGGVFVDPQTYYLFIKQQRMDTQKPAHTSMSGQALYTKLQKLAEDIQLQHSIINAQKETVLKSRQRVYVDNPKVETAIDPSHAVHAHGKAVVQHRAMIIKHYELIQQHKQMVKQQGIHVQNLTSTLLNIQQETTVVDELMNTHMAETQSRQRPTIEAKIPTFVPPNTCLAIEEPPIPTTPIIPASPDISIEYQSQPTDGASKRKAPFEQEETIAEPLSLSDSDNVIVDTEDDNTIHVSIMSEKENAKDPQMASITVTTTSTSTESTPISTSLSTTTVSSVSTCKATTTTATTTTTTTFNPSSSTLTHSLSSSSLTSSLSSSYSPDDSEPMPLSP